MKATGPGKIVHAVSRLLQRQFVCAQSVTKPAPSITVIHTNFCTCGCSPSMTFWAIFAQNAACVLHLSENRNPSSSLSGL